METLYRDFCTKNFFKKNDKIIFPFKNTLLIYGNILSLSIITKIK